MRPFFTEIKKLAKTYGIKVKFQKLPKNIAGECYYSENLIIINSTDYSRPALLSTFFHEKVHLDCYKKKIWTEFHSDNPDIQKVKKIAIKVERFVDRVAEMQLYAYDKRVRYIPGYKESNKELRKFINDYYGGQEN